MWPQEAGTGYDLWANRYVPGVGWSEPEPIVTGSTTIYTYDPDVAIDAAGNAMVVWGDVDEESDGLWASRSSRR